MSAEDQYLQLLGIEPSAESLDYVNNKSQFHLHTLLTEQRHKKTWNLSTTIAKDCQAGLESLLSVDDDIINKLQQIASDATSLGNVERIVDAIANAIITGRRIYVYGCGATGRLAKQMESSFWRPFWEDVKQLDEGKIFEAFSTLPNGSFISERLTGEMTGADRALISSLEGFEDLQLIGRLQLADHGIQKGDVVVCVTEGGETSSVIGTILAGLDQWKDADGKVNTDTARQHLFFVYNNPDAVLLPLHRSRAVIENDGITKINLATGPQAITGSTRMQATSSETFLVATVLHCAIERVLRLPQLNLSREQLALLGLTSAEAVPLKDMLGRFEGLLKSVREAIPALAQLTQAEAECYSAGRKSTYFAGRQGLMTIFIDNTERSPTFRLFPLDTVEQTPRKCWVQVWTPSATQEASWKSLLGRPFRGLHPSFYQEPLLTQIDDVYLNKAAQTSLARAGDEQQNLYDFSFSKHNIEKNGPSAEGKGQEIGVLVAATPEEKEFLDESSDFRQFLSLFHNCAGARAALILTTDQPKDKIMAMLANVPGFRAQDEKKIIPVIVEVNSENDPLLINQRIAMKILLNAHSTAVMARLGKVVGNTMTNVSPSNLKLIGRATALILTHVNDQINKKSKTESEAKEAEAGSASTTFALSGPVSYRAANAVLYESIAYLAEQKAAMEAKQAASGQEQKDLGQTAELALSIIRILEAHRRQAAVSPAEALEILGRVGLAPYLESY